MTIWNHCGGKDSNGVKVGNGIKLPAQVDLNFFLSAPVVSVMGRAVSWPWI